LLPQQVVKRAPSISAERLAVRPVPQPSTDIVVPDLIRKHLADGCALLMAQNLKLGVVQDSPGTEATVDLILSQTPPAGAKAPPGTRIAVQVGVTNVAIPALKGRPLQDAEKALEEAHLGLGRITAVNMPGSNAPGLVLNSSPVQGSIVQSHRTVALLVQAGKVKVPDLTGQTLPSLQALLAKNNLALGTVAGEPFRGGAAGGPAVVPQPVSGWSMKGEVVLVGTAIDVIFPGDYDLVDERVLTSLVTSDIAASNGNSVPGNPKKYPTREDRLTSLELLANLEPVPAGAHTVMELMARLNLPPIYPAGIKATEGFEGWEPYLYNDAADYCTIGYGHLIKKAPCNGTEPYQDGLRPSDGVTLLQGDMYSAHAAVARTITIKLTDGQTAALTDFVFNVGSANFRSSTLQKLVNASQFDGVPAQFRRWVMAGGKKLPGLVNRREGEINLFFDGVPRTMMKRLPTAAIENLPPVDIQAGEGH
jgi:GH24 family phage-related lysozyme (muramidase)